MASLSVAIVTYRPDAALLATALRSLAVSVASARARGRLGSVVVHLIDNGPPAARAALDSALAAWDAAAGTLVVHSGHGNLGYGRGNNLVLGTLQSDVHLVMNPDVELDPPALDAALAALEQHPETGLVAPFVQGDDGACQFLCKRYPSVWVLFLRGFAPLRLRERFARSIAHYEMRDLVGDRFIGGVPLASGCFMLVRTPLFLKLGGFDARYFMYFEDYDLSMRIGREAAIAYVPQARIVHHGGEAARKGWRHVAWFVTSAWRFFARHGWKLT
jgi:GT2 family glycosyltransferase